MSASLVRLWNWISLFYGPFHFWINFLVTFESLDSGSNAVSWPTQGLSDIMRDCCQSLEVLLRQGWLADRDFEADVCVLSFSWVTGWLLNAHIPRPVQCLTFGKHCQWWLYTLGKIASCSFVGSVVMQSLYCGLGCNACVLWGQSGSLVVVQLLSRVHSLRPDGLQYPRLPCASPSPQACSNSGSLYKYKGSGWGGVK